MYKNDCLGCDYFYHAKINNMATKQDAAAKGSKSTKSTSGKITPKSDAAEDLRDFLVDGLKDLYWAESHLAKALPKMEKNATSPKLKSAIADHLEQTKNHIKRLEDAFKALGEKAEAEKCDAMEGLLKEGEGIMEETEIGAVRDAAIIAAAQKVEHYEIASYGTLRTYCQHLGEDEVRDLLEATLNEEKTCDELLTELAVSEINLDAMEEGDDEDEKEDEKADKSAKSNKTKSSKK